MPQLFLPGTANGWGMLIVDGTVFPSLVAAVSPGFKLAYAGQTANTSGANVANMSIGTVSIPNTSADGTVITITDSTITAKSIVQLQVKGSSGQKIMLDTVVPAAGSCTFTVRTASGSATTAACDVWYWIIN